VNSRVVFSPYLFAFYVSWAATGLGVGLWLWSWVRVKEPIRRLRFQDCGVVLVFAAVMTRIVIQAQSPGVLDWVILIMGPLFIAAALWRLTRTQGLKS